MCYNVRALLIGPAFGFDRNMDEWTASRSDTLSLNLNITGNRNNYVPAFA